MPEFRKVPLEHVKGRRMSLERQQRIEEMKNYLQSLNESEAGILECREDEDPARVRRNLRTAARLLGKTIRVKLNDKTLTFYFSKKKGM